ncbi:hypothetical protein GALMADRAFT_247801 [Galerina marginata CBS 339.88]|uniref:WD40 repeat-like protein n=1 Tax=Galerina marginata (strain CBS 339.88) TaxID=685588 RepID=A0A067T213_GALM3|nr:hypothetical protein GALMADRAFT_247801 [Galerina marginata CBS 339.88]
MADYQQRISDLSEDLDSFIEDHEDNAPEYQHEVEAYNQGFLDILSGIVGVVRQAITVNLDDSSLSALIKQADQVFNNAITFAYQEMGPYSESHIPSFAHNEGTTPLLVDKQTDAESSHGFAGTFLPHLEEFLNIFGSTVDASTIRSQVKSSLPPAWRTTIRPHPSSTPCARFREVLPAWTATETNNRATAVFEARCEIFSEGIRSAINLRLSPTGNILALSSMGGWKNRTPYITYYLPNHEEGTNGGFMKKHSIQADLQSTVDEIMVDDERRLVFAADWRRVKTYRCNDPTLKGSKAKAVHTLDSSDHTGPLAMLSNGRVLRAGKKNIAVWNLDTLETHGESGRDMIGPKMDMEDTWRDDPESIEPSSGSAPSTTIVLDSEDDGGDEEYEIETWHQHPSQGNVMLCGTNAKEDSQTYFCHAFDVEVGGKAVTRYLGHGGSVEGFSTSAADPNVFLTYCGDGHARIYDVRQVLPVLTIASASQLEHMPAAVLAHPDGVPFAFTGTDESQHIKLWDIRAQKSVYELATGNNSVEAMEWDAHTNTLYAVTCSPYIDWNGRLMNYRTARIPKVKTDSEGEDEEDEDKNSEDEYEDANNYVRWPKRAYHSENYFGYVFDAGGHRFYKFSFKMDANPEVLPYYGSGLIGGGGW